MSINTIKRLKPVRIVACVDWPLSMACFDQYPGGCQQPGFEIEYIYTLIRDFLQLPIEWIKVNTYNEMESYLNDGLADMIGVSIAIDSSKVNRWGYTPPYLKDGVGMLIKETIVNKSESLLLIDQLSWDTWLYLLAITTIVIPLKYLRTFKRKNNQYRNLSTFPIKFTYVLWFIIISVLLNLYGNLVAIDLTSTNAKIITPFTTLDQLADKLLSKECRLAILELYDNEEDEIYKAVINPEMSKSEWSKKFKLASRGNKPLRVKNREEMAGLILNNTCLVGLDWSSIEPYYTSRWCSLKMITFPDDPELNFEYTFYATDPILKKDIATIISSNAFQSFTDKLANKYYYKGYMPDDCEKEKLKPNQIFPINLHKIQGGFYFLFFGSLCALVCSVYKTFRMKVK